MLRDDARRHVVLTWPKDADHEPFGAFIRSAIADGTIPPSARSAHAGRGGVMVRDHQHRDLRCELKSTLDSDPEGNESASATTAASSTDQPTDHEHAPLVALASGGRFELLMWVGEGVLRSVPANLTRVHVVVSWLVGSTTLPLFADAELVAFRSESEALIQLTSQISVLMISDHDCRRDSMC